jgi:hypothetical protein
MLKLVKTCDSHPEQYDVFDTRGRQVAYLRLRWGRFRAHRSNAGGEILYTALTHGHGCFKDHERDEHLREACLWILRDMAKESPKRTNRLLNVSPRKPLYVIEGCRDETAL